MADASDILTGLWYFACPSKALRKGAMVRRILFGEPVVLGRTNEGKVFALRDVCPHRGAPLSDGRLCDEGPAPALACPYHGWRFRIDDGVCAQIPALSEKSDFDCSRISVKRYALHEANGLVWIFHGASEKSAADQSTPPALGLPETATPKTITEVNAAGPYDEAVIGLVDPAHTPFVHRQWWWREGKPAEEKIKHFEPIPLGFRMPPHRPSSNSRIYAMLGGAPTTEIAFQLPGIRLETIRNKRHTIAGLTAITPTEAGESLITHLLFWDMPVLTLLKPVISAMASSFLAQDGAILRAQNRNLAREKHRPLYAGDPDVPAQWYHALKRAWRESQSGAAFVHPLTEKTLRWRT